ncbi:MAG: hypothetical protein ACJ71T_12060 [Actinomycetales bacterium]
MADYRNAWTGLTTVDAGGQVIGHEALMGVTHAAQPDDGTTACGLPVVMIADNPFGAPDECEDCRAAVSDEGRPHGGDE